MGNRKAKGPPLGLPADFAPFGLFQFRERFRITAIGHSPNYDAQGDLGDLGDLFKIQMRV